VQPFLLVWAWQLHCCLAVEASREGLEELVAREERSGGGDARSALLALVRQHDANAIAHYLDTRGTAELDVADSSGITPLWQATLAMRSEVVALLAARNADLNVQKKKSGLTPLMVASMNGDTGTLKALIKAGADIDLAVNRAGATALALAFQSGQAESARLLMEEGARVDLALHAWKTVVRLLLRSGAKQDEELLETIAEAVESDAEQKLRLETLVHAASQRGGTLPDEDDEEFWREEQDFMQLSPPEKHDDL